MKRLGLMAELPSKIFSLAVAATLFTFVSVERSTPVDVEFPVEYQLGPNMMIVGEPVQSMRATLRGPWAFFRTFEAELLEPVVIDLKAAGPGPVSRFLSPDEVRAPPGMQVTTLRPSQLEVRLDRRVERQISVRPDIPGRPAFGFEILNVTVVPARVSVLGPMTKMGELDFISSRALDVADREEDLTLEVDLRPPPPPMRLKTQRVTVHVEIAEEIVDRVFRDKPVILENAARAQQVVPPMVDVGVRGPRRLVEAMGEDLSVFVDVAAEADETLVTRIVQLRDSLPERTQLLAPVPKVEISLKPE